MFYLPAENKKEILLESPDIYIYIYIYIYICKDTPRDSIYL